ncbi:MAG TPA: alpha/beta hydrolase [Methylomirabilota bacterium]
MRQPEVAGRLAALALALVLAAPVARDAVSLLRSAAFLAEFLTDGALPALSAVTPAPVREALGPSLDRWTGIALGTPPPLLLVHGYAPQGKDDPRLARAARLLARAGFDVVVPTLPGLTRGRLRPDDAGPVVQALSTRPGPWVIVSVSIGAAPAFAAAADTSVRDRVGVLLALGPHASAAETVRFWLTGAYEFDGVSGRMTHDPALVHAFLDANADLVDDATRAALAAGDTARVERALAALPPAVRGLLERLSPARAMPDVRARVILVHGYADPAVPYSESLRLAAARPARTRVVLLAAVGHVEAAPGPLWRAARDGLRLLLVFHALRHAG